MNTKLSTTHYPITLNQNLRIEDHKKKFYDHRSYSNQIPYFSICFRDYYKVYDCSCFQIELFGTDLLGIDCFKKIVSI